jgi:hypothetical protein
MIAADGVVRAPRVSGGGCRLEEEDKLVEVVHVAFFQLVSICLVAMISSMWS